MALFASIRGTLKVSKAKQLLIEQMNRHALRANVPDLSERLLFSLIHRYPTLALYKASPELLASAALSGGVKFFDEKQEKEFGSALFALHQDFLTSFVFKRVDTSNLSLEDGVLYKETMSCFEFGK